VLNFRRREIDLLVVLADAVELAREDAKVQDIASLVLALLRRVHLDDEVVVLVELDLTDPEGAVRALHRETQESIDRRLLCCAAIEIERGSRIEIEGTQCL